MKKFYGLLVFLISYVLAFVAGLFITKLCLNHMHILFAIFLGNVVATFIIWLIGVFFKTASLYDPYWSLQTICIALALLIKYNNWNLGNILFLLCVSFWAIRLTNNFIVGFNDLSYIDWRYKDLQNKSGKFYQLVNLFGICMIPTIIVYMASLPMFLYIINGVDFSWLNIFGLLTMIIATLLEMISDINMHQFKRTRKSNKEIIRTGLWKYSRHPNYLGEILFWYGVLLTFILSSEFNISLWYAWLGAILNTLLFLFISIPMAENHLKLYKENFAKYKKETRMLLPIKK